MGASHGIGYVLGAVFDVPHGHTSCIMLPAVMRWNMSVNAERQALVAAAMGHPGDDAADVLDAFIAGLGMPRSLGAVNVGVAEFDRIAEQAMGTPWVPRNPRRHRWSGAGARDIGIGGVAATASWRVADWDCVVRKLVRVADGRVGAGRGPAMTVGTEEKARR